MSTPLVHVRNLTVTSTSTHEPVVQDVSFEVGEGEILGIVGESGSGKSVTCKTVLGILPQQLQVSRGAVELQGSNVLGLGYNQWRTWRGRFISAVFQDPGSYLNPTIPVGRQLQEALREQEGLGRREAARRADTLLSELGLDPDSGISDKLPRELSGGMLQRSVIAIALAGRPS